MVAITVHNIPEGLAVGVSFGAIGNTESATFESARYVLTMFRYLTVKQNIGSSSSKLKSFRGCYTLTVALH